MYLLKDYKREKKIHEINHLFDSWCYARGKNVWKTWKRRYYALVQVKNSYDREKKIIIRQIGN